ASASIVLFFWHFLFFCLSSCTEFAPRSTGCLHTTSCLRIPDAGIALAQKAESREAFAHAPRRQQRHHRDVTSVAPVGVSTDSKGRIPINPDQHHENGGTSM
ncbi:unnamed protein product, partial [Ixodes pacificus]